MNPQFPTSNAMQKQDMGVMPDPLMSALNALLTQMSGTSYAPNPAATSYAPPRTMPNGMQMNVAPQPSMPEPNPLFHAQSPMELDLGTIMREAMGQPFSLPPGMEDATAMGDQASLPPSSSPKKSEAPAVKKSNKPQPAKGKGGPSTDPKRIAPPSKKKKMLAGK